MTDSDRVKVVIGVLLFITWAIFAAFGRTPVTALIEFIEMALTGLAAHYLTGKGNAP